MGDDQLHCLRSEAFENNLKHEVTGLLFYVEKYFVQVIEGPHAAIGELFSNIRCDTRNQAVIEIFDRDVGERSFQDWAMGFYSPQAADGAPIEGFHNLRSRSSFDAIEQKDPALFSMMQDLYIANAGRGF